MVSDMTTDMLRPHQATTTAPRYTQNCDFDSSSSIEPGGTVGGASRYVISPVLSQRAVQFRLTEDEHVGTNTWKNIYFT